MVAKHQDDGRLVLMAKVIYKQLESFVALVCEGEVLLCHRIFSGLIGEGDLSRVVFYGVAAVILDGDVKQKQAFFRRLVLKFVDDLVKGGLIADIAMFLGQRNIHILHAFKLVESQQRICLIALPGGSFARMDGKGSVTVFFEQGGKRSGRLQHILLVRDAA